MATGTDTGSAPHPTGTLSIIEAIDHQIELERSRELEKVRGWGKVKIALEQRKTQKLARALLKKANIGPLDEQRKRKGRKSSGEKISWRERVRHRKSAKEEPSDGKDDDRVTVGRRDIGGAFEEKIMEAQEEELDQLRSMKVVQKHLGKRETSARARRMFNRRVVTRPTLSRRTSFLVTGYEETDETEVAEYIRQQSEMVIDNFFSIPPKERRVLDRLTSTQIHWISDAELGKVRARQRGQLDSETINEGKRRDSEPTDVRRASEQMEPGMFDAVSNDENKVKRRHRLLKRSKKENEEKPSTKKDRGWRRNKGEKRRHHWDVVEEGMLDEADAWSEWTTGPGRRHSSRAKTSQGGSKVHLPRTKEMRRKSWKRQGRTGSDALEQYEQVRESDVMPDHLISEDSEVRPSSVGSSHGPTSPKSIPLHAVQSQPTLHSVKATQKSTVITAAAGSANQVVAHKPYQASIPDEREKEDLGDDVFQADLDSGDSPELRSASPFSPTPPPSMSHSHLLVGMGAPPPLENGHFTSAITEDSHNPWVQMASALDSGSEDSETGCEPFPMEERDEDKELATSDRVQNSKTVGRKEAEIRAPVMGNGQVNNKVIPSPEQDTNIEREECEVAPLETQQQPSGRNLVPDYHSPRSPVMSTTPSHRGSTAEDQIDGSFETVSPKPKMFYLDGSSQTSSFDSNPSTGSSKYKRFFSSPQLSLTSGENSLQFGTRPYMTGLCRYGHTPHGYYSYESEVNPFSAEFQEALKVNQERNQERSPNKCEAAAFSSQQSSTSTSRHEPSQAPDLPPQMLNDPGFRIYSAGLDHNPTRSDYISYKLALIGDTIDAKYDTQLNQALDALFTEVLKNTITWDSFSRVTKKLLWQGQYIQDGIFMIPCFGRRLLEFVPQLRDTITGYTRRVMDNSWDLILNSGGWDAMMEGYGHPELSPDYEDWKKQSQEEGEGSVDAVGAMGYDLFSPDFENRGFSFAIASTAADRAVPHQRTPHTLPRVSQTNSTLPVSPQRQRNQPYSFDDTVGHPRIIDPHCLFLDPLTGERSTSCGGHLRRRVNSVEVLLSKTGDGDDTLETDNIRSIPAGILRLESRRHSSPSIHSNEAFLIPGVSSSIPIPSVRTYNPGSQEGLSSMPHVISIGNGRGLPVMETFSMKQTTVVESGHGFISVGHYTHSRESSIGSIGSCSTIHIVTGEETLIEDLHLSQPVSSGEELHQHGPSQSEVSVIPGSSNRPGSRPNSAHSTGGSRAAKRTASGDSTSEYMDLGFNTVDFTRQGRPARSSTDSVFTYDVGSGEWKTVNGTPKQRRRRRSSLQVVSENIATVGPILTHAAIGVFAVVFAGRQ